MRQYFLVLALSCLSFVVSGQTFSYVNGTLDLTVRGFNPCGGPSTGYLSITVNGADGGGAVLIFLDGPGANDDFGVPILQGDTYTFNLGRTLPAGTYQFIIRDLSNNFTINTFVDPINYPPLQLTAITPPALSEDIRIDNSSCSFPTTGQIQSTISGGSMVLAGGGSFDYTWSSDNGLAGLPLSGTTDGTTPLNLATLLGVPGLPGGNYTLTVRDNYSSNLGVPCSAVRVFSLTDPSPTVFAITTPSPQNICFGDNLTITLAGSDGGSVVYEIIRNGVGTGLTFPGLGAAPFVMTFPSGGFSSGDVIQVRATDGFCSPATMTGSVVANISPQATVDAGLPQAICSDATASLSGVIGGSATSATWTTSGDGTFNNGTLLNAIYTPGPNDIISGTVNLTLTTNDPAGPCPAVADVVTIIIDPAASVDAGLPQTICSDATASLVGVIGGSAVSAAWSTSGDGSFNNAALLNAVYTPGANDITNGTVTLTLTTNDPAGPCPAVADNVVITIDLAATVDAGPPQTVCSDAATVVLAGTIGGTATSATWTTGGDGSFDNVNLLTATYTPGPNDITGGSVTLTLTTNDPAGPCTAAVDNVVITINPAATVDAGLPQTICSDGTAALAGVIGGGASSATWTTSGDGSFSNATLLNAVYTPGANDITNGTVTLTLTTNDPVGPCAPAVDNVVITINPAATVDAGLPQTICSDGTATLAGVIGGSAGSATWSTSGDGSFNNASLLNAIYTPGPTDITNGSVTLTLTTNDPAGPCVPAVDNVVITINPAATVDAGLPQTICSDGTVTMAGVIGGGASSATWSTSGDGSFNNTSLLNAIYTPGVNDIASGTVTLTLTTNDPAGPCGPANDNVVITVQPAATVDAGSPQTICSDATATLAGVIGGSATSATWTTSGDGSFNNVALLNAVYTPGPNDITNGTVTLTLTTNDPAGACPAVADIVVITINPAATVDAGLPQAICSDGTVTLAGVIGGSAASATWSTSGDGSFNNASLLNAIYSPGANDFTNGTVTLTLTTNDPAGPCLPAVDNVVITIDPAATVDAGTPQTVCSNGTATLAGVIGGSATSSTWTTAGDGTFNNATFLNAVYTPGPNDITAGSVVLTLTTNDPAGGCPAVTDNVTITITPEATADAGVPQTICSDGTVTLAGAIGGSASSATWTTSGDGTFNNASLLNAIYTPGANDITNGTVTLTLTTNDPAGPCTPAVDNVVITIDLAATVDAGTPQSICANETATLAGTFGGSAVIATWSTSGDGAFDNATLLNAVYTPGPNDITAGTVTLTLTTNDPAGLCPAATDNVVISISPLPDATFSGLSGPYCDNGSSVILIPTTAGGTFSGPGVSGNTFDPALAGAGTHVIQYQVTVGGCTSTTTQNVDVNPAPDATITPAGPFCTSDAAVTLTAATAGGTWFGVGITDAALGIFDPMIAGPGVKGISYQVTVGGCTSTGNINITVFNAPDATITPAGPFCTTDGAVTLTAVTPGGLWSGTGITDAVLGTFNPSVAGAGSHVITYAITVGGCSDSQNTTIDVGTPPDATITPAGPFCASDAAVTLVAATAGGTWSGPGITDANAGTFDPAVAGAGIHSITYLITIGSCSDTDAISITVDPAPDATITPAGPFCTTDAAVNLVAATAGGTWSGTGITDVNAGTFDPAVAGAGSFVITYSITQGTCSDTDNITIVVGTPPDATITLVGPFCSNDAAVTLTAVTPGGTWSGTGITDANAGTFDPATAGAGTHAITYSITIGGCSDTDNINIDVNPAPDATITPAGPFCTLDAAVNLVAATAGGTWSGTGITDVNAGTFDPSVAGAGSFVITYSITQGGCTDTDNITIVVGAPPDATITPAGPFCTNDASVTLTAVSAGGTWSGTGITDANAGTFDPAVAGAGTHTITYTIAIGGCNDTDNIDIVVNPAPDATITPAGPFCTLDAAVNLVAANAGGTWSGTGITDVNAGTFDPAVAGAGSFVITYSVTAGPCTDTDNITIVVGTPPDATITAVGPFCTNDASVTLSAVTAGGTWSGTGITDANAGTFDPAVAGSGTHTITYTIAIGGCNDTDNIDIVVNPAPAASINPIGAFCPASPVVNLVGAPIGGVWSGAGITNAALGTFDPAVAGPGSHIISYTVTLGGCSDVATRTITVRSPADPACTGGGTGDCATVVINPQPVAATCANSDGSVFFDIVPAVPALNVTGVIININGPVNNTKYNEFNFPNIPAGTYAYTIVYGDSSCIKTGFVTIDQSGTVGTPTVTEIVPPLCFGASTGSARITVSNQAPGDFLEWSLDNITWTSFINGGVVTGLPAGPSPSFNLDVSIRRNSSDLCYAKAIINIQSVNPEITATFNVTPATCNGSDGAMMINAAGGGGAPYEFSIDNGNTFQASNSFINLSGGSYSVVVRDAAGCTQAFTANVTFPGFINHTLLAVNADCTNGGNSGSITVAINDPGVFEIAISEDQFNEPDDSEYQNYNNPSVTFGNLARGTYYIYMKSGGVTCPTRSAPVVINGVFALSFDVLPVCNGNERSISLTNMQFDPAVPYTIHVYRKNTSIEVNGFPLTIGSSDPSFITRSILLNYNTYTFLQSPDEYQIQLEQFQVSAVCIITSELVDYQVLPPVFATVVETTQSPSDIDIGTITLEITAGTGAPEYSTSIKLDSAAAFTQFYEDEHLTVAQDVDGRYIDRYEDVPAGRYEVIVTDADGCFLELVPPARVRLDTRIIIPNVFTPNDDDVNDTFYIRNLPESGNQLIITNRWGNEVFTSSDYNRTNFWSGDGVVDGTYFYNLKVQSGDVYTGWVEIIRGQKP